MEPRHTFFEPDVPIENGGRYALKLDVDFLKGGRVTLYWCDGNHENHDALDELEKKNPGEAFISVMPGVFYARFGSVLSLLDGTRVMFCGGASSDDAHLRVSGREWWTQESIDQTDMDALPDASDTRIDWIVSHTSPARFAVTSGKARLAKNADASRLRLEDVRKAFCPSAWWHGHYHLYESGEHEGCAWTSLDCLVHGGRWLEKKLITR